MVDSFIVTTTTGGVRAPEHHGPVLRGVSRRRSRGGGLFSTLSTTTAAEEQQAPREGPARGGAPTRAPPCGLYRSVISTELHVVLMTPRISRCAAHIIGFFVYAHAGLHGVP